MVVAPVWWLVGTNPMMGDGVRYVKSIPVSLRRGELLVVDQPGDEPLGVLGQGLGPVDQLAGFILGHVPDVIPGFVGIILGTGMTDVGIILPIAVARIRATEDEADSDGCPHLVVVK